MLYHHYCTDGAYAFAAARLCLQDKAVYIPYNFEAKPEEWDVIFERLKSCIQIFLLDIAGDKVFRQRLVDMISKEQPRFTHYVSIHDHHETGFNDLQEELGDTLLLNRDKYQRHELQHENVRFIWHLDMKESGATMAWKYFHVGTSVPRVFEYVRDNDLWKHELPGTHEFTMGFRDTKWDFQNPSAELMEKLLTVDVDATIEKGKVLVILRDQAVETAVARSYTVKLMGYLCLQTVVELETMEFNSFSHIGHALAEKSAAIPDHVGMAAIVIVPLGKRDLFPHSITGKLSLRSTKDFNCEPVARHYGGGGHKQAASTPFWPLKDKVDVEYMRSMELQE